jgi:penicillin-binding protein 1C
MAPRDGRSLKVSGIRAAVSAALSYLLVLAAVAALRTPRGALEEIPYSTAVFDRNGVLLRLTLSSDQKYRMKAATRDFPAHLAEAILLK